MKRQRQLLIILVSGFLVYLNSLRNGFVWDDILTAVNNDFIKGWALLGEAFTRPLYYLTKPEYLYYRPLLTFSFILDYSVWGLRPFGFHLTNILLHLLAALLVYKSIELILKDETLAFCSGLLFALHPLNTSVVSYVTGRADILAAVFMLLSLIVFLKARTSYQYIFSWVCFALALLSKESALVFPAVLIFTAEMLGNAKPDGTRETGRGRIYYLGFIVLAAAYVFLRIKVAGVGFNFAAAGKIGFLGFLGNFAKISISYIRLSFFPWGLHMLRNIPLPQLKDNLAVILPLSLGLPTIAFFIYKFDRKIFLLLGLFVLLLSPVSVVSLKNPEYFIQGYSVMEEHWMYLNTAVVAALVFYLIRKAGSRLPGAFHNGLVFIFALFLALICAKENGYWKNNQRLFTRTLHYVKNSTTAYRNLAWTAVSRGDAELAVKLYRQALAIRQTDEAKALLYRDLAYAYLLEKDTDMAGEAVKEGIKLNPGSAGLHGLLGLLYSGNNDAKAREEWELALRKDPFDPMAFNGMLVLSRSKGEVSISLVAKYRKMLKAARSFDSYKVYRSLGLLYLYSDLDIEAMVHLKRALRINPYDIKSNNALAVCYVKRGNARMAEAAFKRSLRLNPFDREIYGNLALFYKESGREEESRAMMRKASSVNIFD